MEFVGKIKKLLPIVSGKSQKGTAWKKQEFIVEEEGKRFPLSAIFSIFGEEHINNANLEEGKQVRVSFDIVVREYNGKFFNDIRAFSVKPQFDNDKPQPTVFDSDNDAPF